MKRLEDLSIGQRTMLMLAIVLMIIFAIAFIGWISGGWNMTSEDYLTLASADEPLTASKYDERIIELDHEAADNAYRDQIEHLFAIWMKDDSGQPERAHRGATQARKAYINVKKAIEKRESDLRKLRELSPQN